MKNDSIYRRKKKIGRYFSDGREGWTGHFLPFLSYIYKYVYLKGERCTFKEKDFIPLFFLFLLELMLIIVIILILEEKLTLCFLFLFFLLLPV